MARGRGAAPGIVPDHRQGAVGRSSAAAVVQPEEPAPRVRVEAGGLVRVDEELPTDHLEVDHPLAQDREHLRAEERAPQQRAHLVVAVDRPVHDEGLATGAVHPDLRRRARRHGYVAVPPGPAPRDQQQVRQRRGAEWRGRHSPLPGQVVVVVDVLAQRDRSRCVDHDQVLEATGLAAAEDGAPQVGVRNVRVVGEAVVAGQPTESPPALELLRPHCTERPPACRQPPPVAGHGEDDQRLPRQPQQVAGHGEHRDPEEGPSDRSRPGVACSPRVRRPPRGSLVVRLGEHGEVEVGHCPIPPRRRDRRRRVPQDHGHEHLRPAR